MKKLLLTLLIPLLPVMVGVVDAATHSSILDIQVKHIEFVRLIGSAAGIDKVIVVDDIRSGSVVNIGTLGLESSISGSCSLDFKSLNSFSLEYSQKGKQSLADYQLEYDGKIITSDITLVMPCKTLATALDFKATSNVKKNPRPGFYSDTITLTVTTQ